MIMDRVKLRLILDEVLETGISDIDSYRGGWLNKQEYLEAKEQNLVGTVDLILHLISKLESEDES